MKVTIMYRNSFVGGDGWRYHPMDIEISDRCQICGDKRGTPKPTTFCEDGEWYTVDEWINECGHIDRYKDCYLEFLETQK
jgi:rRNA maturation protein Nop10